MYGIIILVIRMDKKKAFYSRRDYLIDLINAGVDIKKCAEYINEEYDKNRTRIFYISGLNIPSDQIYAFFEVLIKYYKKYYISDLKEQEENRYSYNFFTREFGMSLVKYNKSYDEKILNVICEFPSCHILKELARSIANLEESDKIKTIKYIKDNIKKSDNYKIFINELKKDILLYSSNLSSDFKKEYNIIFLDDNSIIKSDNDYDYVKNKMKSFLLSSKGYYDYLGLIAPMEKDLKILSPKENFKIYCEVFDEIIDELDGMQHYSNIFNFIREIGYFDDIDFSNRIYDMLYECEKSAKKNNLDDIFYRYFWLVEPTIILLLIKNSMFDEAQKLYIKSKKLKTICSNLEYQLDQDKTLFKLNVNEINVLDKIRKGVL